ncbi:hypothetical protein CJ199_15990 [Brevibacterium paucivorans]|uniref:Uncharacterized protein n=1 Tax=Brevibacterium paucivorans TaxID=170994 RepID=A0A2N6VI51_9MICO|nr:hypothetical protein CJ199_15990 [Brevibacterium paucivorans]
MTVEQAQESARYSVLNALAAAKPSMCGKRQLTNCPSRQLKVKKKIRQRCRNQKANHQKKNDDTRPADGTSFCSPHSRQPQPHDAGRHELLCAVHGG